MHSVDAAPYKMHMATDTTFYATSERSDAVVLAPHWMLSSSTTWFIVIFFLVTSLTIGLTINHTGVFSSPGATPSATPTPTPSVTPSATSSISQFDEVAPASINWSNEFSGPGSSRLAAPSNRVLDDRSWLESRLLADQTIQFDCYDADDEGFFIYNTGESATQYCMDKTDGSLTSEALAGVPTNTTATHTDNAYIAIRTVAAPSYYQIFSCLTLELSYNSNFKTGASYFSSNLFNYTSMSDPESGRYAVVVGQFDDAILVSVQNAGESAAAYDVLINIPFASVLGLRTSSAVNRISVAIFVLRTVYYYDLPAEETPALQIAVSEDIVDVYLSNSGSLLVVLTATSLRVYSKSGLTFSLVDTLVFEGYTGVSLGVNDLGTSPLWCCVGNSTESLVLVPCTASGFELDDARVLITTLSNTSGACAIRYNTDLYIVCSSSGSSCFATSIDTALI